MYPGLWRYWARPCYVSLSEQIYSTRFHQVHWRFVRWNSHLSPGDAGPVKQRRPNATNPWIFYPASILVVAGVGVFMYQESQSFRHASLAVVRCSRVARAAALGIIDYKRSFSASYTSEDDRQLAYSQCHTRSAKRVLRALLANGGIYIKLGQHLSSVAVLPKEWTATMRPLQDQCHPTPYEEVEELFLTDMGKSISELFDDFDPNPIGVASLAQVHVGRHRDSGKTVAVKLQHPYLAEFCDVDMEMVEVIFVKRFFPDFELTWLGEEMRTNLPKELDFVNEAANAAKTIENFDDVRTSLYIPAVIVAKKRVLIMEYIQGGRVDDLEYLAKANIDRNKVALELSRIFNRMVFMHGWFHADPHPGNLLIRPAPEGSKSPYNFEIVLLDHGLYFDIDTDLRLNYSNFWLSLLAPGSSSTNADRRKYAQLVGNVGPDLYPVFEAAITGRAALEGTWDTVEGSEKTYQKASGMLSATRQSEEEVEAIRYAVVNRKDLLVSVFDVLRRVPRRVLMVLKLNDLTRNLDNGLMTTHSNVRIFLIMAKMCHLAVWRNDQKRLIGQMRDRGLLSFGLLFEYFGCWWKYERGITSLVFVESFMDIQAFLVKSKAWIRGLLSRGLEGAHQAAAGLA
ncbi:ABC1-domain-containing protein [Marasmius fiardii PR-910]|nr:ABC1-domain-containing protein [Marasmius fiardii PR-910]